MATLQLRRSEAEDERSRRVHALTRSLGQHRLSYGIWLRERHTADLDRIEHELKQRKDQAQ